MINVPNITQSSMNNKTDAILSAKPIQASNKSQLEYINNTDKYTANIYPQETIPVYTRSQTKAPEFTEPKVIHTSWFYINDVHGKMTNMERIYNISREFDQISPSDINKTFYTNSTDNVSKFKVASGDIILGANFTNNQVANQLIRRCL